MIINPYIFGSSVPLLLDTYPNAAVAYSVRKLRTAYSGSALRVRRSSDNAESDIGFVANQLDTASLLSFVGAGNGFVTTWYDQSGNGNNARQTTASLQPQIVSSGNILTLNSKPAIQANTSIKQLTTINNISYNECLVTTVFNRTGRVGSYDNLYGFNSSPDNQLYSNTSNWSYFSNSVTYNTTIPLSTSQTILSQIDNGTNTILYNNTITDSNFLISNNISSATLNLFGYGGINGMLGNIQEFILYNINQQTNKTNIENNVVNYFNINLNINSSGAIWDGTQSGMLNTYSGAAVAYSVRALNSAYTGPLIRVRRSSDNAETNIYALQNGNLDTAYLLSFAGAGNAFVVNLYDQSGNDRITKQTTANNQPQIVNAGSIIQLNSKPALLTDGSDNFNINNLSKYSRLDSYFVMKPNDTTYLYPFNTTSGIYYGYVAQNGSSSSGLPSNYGTPSLYINNVLFTGTTRTNVYNSLNLHSVVLHENSSNLTWIGIDFNLFNYSGYEYTGNVQEIILYPSDKSASRTAIYTNIQTYFGI